MPGGGARRWGWQSPDPAQLVESPIEGDDLHDLPTPHDGGVQRVTPG
jgi:hypothetical protein